MTVLVVLGLGLAIGVILGALGGGGSVLTVPALVYVVGEPARGATTGSLVIVGIAAGAACLGHARAHRVQWRTGAQLAVTGVIASYAGTRLNAQVSPTVLLTCFAVLVLVSATALLAQNAPAGAPEVTVGTTLTRVRPARVGAKVLGAGLLVGFLTGFLGVGGGFVIVPALVLIVGLDMPVAVGTSLLVIALNSGTALLLRAGHTSFHWSVIVPFTAAALAGSALGRRVGDRTSGQALTRAFAVLLVAVGLYVLSQALL